jgi:hypothetical protein
MARRSSVYDLPQAVRDELNARLVQRGFGGYSELRDWLTEQGFQISRSAVHRYGVELETEYEAAMGDVRRANEMARAYAQADPDDSAALTGSIARMAQESLLRILLSLRKAEAAGDANTADMARHMSQVSRALADLGRVTIQHSKHAADVRRRLAAEAADRAEVAASRGGVSPDGIAALRAAIMEGL